MLRVGECQFINHILGRALTAVCFNAEEEKVESEHIDLKLTTVHKCGKSQSNDWYHPFQKMRDDLFSVLCESRPTRFFFSEMLWLIVLINSVSCLCFEAAFL